MTVIHYFDQNLARSSTIYISKEVSYAHARHGIVGFFGLGNPGDSGPGTPFTFVPRFVSSPRVVTLDVLPLDYADLFIHFMR